MAWPTIAAMLILYRAAKAEFFIMKTGYYLVEWVGAKQQGRAGR